jgi:hypothetical protein
MQSSLFTGPVRSLARTAVVRIRIPKCLYHSKVFSVEYRLCTLSFKQGFAAGGCEFNSRASHVTCDRDISSNTV